MEQLSSLNTTEPIDYDNLNIVIHPRPPRRRQSGTSLVPFRPYVKRLSSVREAFSFANGHDEWVTYGQKETFFKQENARCIGSLLDDCDVSDVIRWDIEGESTRLPMMCKLWIIVDGAVVERGKPHLVQDAAVQVYTVGRNLRSILAVEQRFNPSAALSTARRRRQSWHDVNEYHSVPYYQYTRAIRSGFQKNSQCDLDNEQMIGKEHSLMSLDETIEEHNIQFIDEQQALETIHNASILHERAQISAMTQTEYQGNDCSTTIDADFAELFHLSSETNENLLSSIVNPNNRHISTANPSWEITSLYRRGIEFINRGISTGDDYPEWWLQLSTNVLLSNHLTNQGERKEIKEKIVRPSSPLPSLIISPRQHHEQSVQTDEEKPIPTETEKVQPPSSTRSSRLRNSSSSMTMSNHYQFIDEIDDGNNDQRNLPFPDYRQRNDSQGDLESRSSDYPIEFLSNHDDERKRRAMSSSKHSETDYNTFALALDHRPYSTPDHLHVSTSRRTSTNEIKVNRSKTSANTSSGSTLGTLLERYERTLRERQRAIAVVNDELLDIDDVVKHYREKIRNSSETAATIEVIQPMEIQGDGRRSTSSIKDERPQSSLSSVSQRSKKKYRSMPVETSSRMLQCYVPSPRLSLSHSMISSSRQRQPRYDYSNLTLTDENLNSAWIRYNERRIDQLQKRIDLMLQIEDNEETQLLLSTIHPITSTVTEQIDDILAKKPRRGSQLVSTFNQMVLPPRYQFRLPYRLNQTTPNSPRLTSRTVSRSTTPVSKSVRISTKKDFIPEKSRLDDEITWKSSSRPIVSILRRNPSSPTRSRRLVEKSHVWKNDVDGKVYILDQFSIPRYYRLYNDVSFREVYQFSRLLEAYLGQHQPARETYSSMIRSFALEKHLPTVTTLA